MFLEIRNFKKNYKNIEAVSDVSLSIEKGEIVCLLGPSGCGKTTTLRMISGLEKEDAGEIFLEQQNITNLSADKREISTVFQSYALFPHMTVWENILYGLKFKKIGRKDKIERGLHYLKVMGIVEQKDKKIQELSGGQMQRVALARALIVNPKVLLLDEPLSNLDAKLRIKMREEIRNINSIFDITMVFVTHDQEEAMSIADRIAIMDKGKIVQIGTPEEIYKNPATSFVLDFMGEVNILDNRNKLKYVRPENIRIHRTKGEVSGSIESKMFLGGNILYHVASEGRILRVKALSENEDYAVGESIKISYQEREL